MERSVQWHRDEDLPEAAAIQHASNAYGIFKRTFETEFGQKSLKIGRILAACRAMTPGFAISGMLRRIVLPQKRRSLAAVRHPRYIRERIFP
jgi:hypothetical protein